MVRQGYKQTEVGMIPEDWDVRKIGDFTDATAGGTPSTSHPEYWNGEILWMSSGELNNRRIHNVVGRITELGYNNSSTHLIPANCVLIGLAGQGKTRGTVAVNYVELCTNQSIAAIFPSKEHNSEYLYQNLWSRYEELRELSSGDGGRGGLNLAIIKNFPCAFPRLQEQNRIAEALSDVDRMISSLEKLIAKKKAVKQGVMQELLTGKKRLPGFSGEWQESTLGALCYLITKQTGFDYTNEIKPSLVDINSSNTLPFVQNKDFECKNVNVKTDYYIPYDIAIKYPRILLDETCLLISLSGRIGNVGLYEKSNGLAFIGGAVGICRFKDEQNSEWCMLYLQSSAGQKQIFECQKSGAQHNLTVEDVRKLVIKLPSSLEEQAAIASILSDMDNEIKTLEQKLDKTRQIKQGMMQQLLTGKIRLV